MTKIITLEDKEYKLSPLKFNRKTIDFIESISSGDTNKLGTSLSVAFDLLIDCMVRGGDVKDADEAEALLSTKDFSQETIKEFISLMTA